MRRQLQNWKWIVCVWLGHKWEADIFGKECIRCFVFDPWNR